MTEKTKEAVKTLNKVKKYLKEEEYFNILECIVENNNITFTPLPYFPYFPYQEPLIQFTTVTSTSSDETEKEWREKHYDK